MVTKTDVDATSRELHACLASGLISRDAYREAFDALYDEVPQRFRRAIDGRRDRRSLGEFALDIYDTTRRERELIADWNERNHLLFRVECLGSDDAGIVVFDPRNLSSNADYRVSCGGSSYKLEVKFCPTLAKLTYKVKDLRAYIMADAYVLTVMYDRRALGEVVDPARLRWTLMTPAIMKRLLDEIPVRNHWEMGRKPSVQILAKDFGNYVEVNPW
jgi:hypothetical protein